MLKRASLVFVGVIQGQHFDSWPLFRLNIPGQEPDSAKYWKVLRREVRVETILRGSESRPVVQIYEIFWMGATSGDWNLTHDGERDLFLVRLENGRYHVVRDWWRSIFPVTSGPHSRLPLDESHPLWERIALMNWWVPGNDPTARITYPYFGRNDPGGMLSAWRTVKLERGLVQHPSRGIRVPACRELLFLRGWGQDECWEKLSDGDRAHLSDGGSYCCISANDIAATRRGTENRGTLWWWKHSDVDNRRLLTAINNPRMRSEFCYFWSKEYPNDHDNGCPADQSPPATIVTERGDVPLIGRWPGRRLLGPAVKDRATLSSEPSWPKRRQAAMPSAGVAAVRSTRSATFKPTAKPRPLATGRLSRAPASILR